MTTQTKETARGYSLWLMPGGEDYKLLEKVISKLSKDLGFHRFKPHVTLVGEASGQVLPVILGARRLIDIVLESKISGIEIILEGIGLGEEYFRPIYANVVATPQLINLNRQAREVLGLKQEEYTPHLSLAYGNFSVEAKKRVAEEVGNSLNFSFKVDRLHVYRTIGRHDDWESVSSYKFDGRHLLFR